MGHRTGKRRWVDGARDLEVPVLARHHRPTVEALHEGTERRRPQPGLVGGDEHDRPSRSRQRGGEAGARSPAAPDDVDGGGAIEERAETTDDEDLPHRLRRLQHPVGHPPAGDAHEWLVTAHAA